MSSTQDTRLKTSLLQLECHFTWALNKNDLDLADILKRLEENLNLNLGRKVEVACTHSCMGFVKYLLGSNTEALRYFEKSVELTKSPGNECDKLLVVVYGDLAWLHYRMGNLAECESYLNKLSEIKAKYPSVSYAEVLGEQGWTFFSFSYKYYERAKECFEKALKLKPEEGEWNAGLAITLYRIEKDTSASTAIDQLRKAIATDPDNDYLKVLLGLRLYHHMNEEAESLVKQAIERSPEDPRVIRYAAKYFRNIGSVDMSIALLKTALAKVSTSALHHQLGLCYNKKINMQKAGTQDTEADINQNREQCIYHLEKAIQLNPNFITAMGELAFQYGENKDFSKAEEMFQDAFQMAKEKNDNHQDVHFSYAKFYQNCMKCESVAIRHFIECLKINPQLYQAKKSAKELDIIANTRIKNNPMDGEAFGILGIIHKEKGEKQQAIKCFETALSFVDNEDYLSDLCELRLSL